MAKRIQAILSLILMLFLLTQTDLVVSAATEGLFMCLHSVIPSLLPFMIISGFVRKQLSDQAFFILSSVKKLCMMPDGCEILWLIGSLGGYPVGACCISAAYKEGAVSKEEAARLLGFCCNCGPAFLFGVLGAIIKDIRILWAIWGIHIISSLITGWIFSKKRNEQSSRQLNTSNKENLLLTSIRSISLVCVWVLLFKIFLAFVEKILPKTFPQYGKILLYGFLELTNGSILLQTTETIGAKFLLGSCLLAFGGFCVAIQTISIAKGIPMRYYFLGKSVQASISLLLCCLFQPILLSRSEQMTVPAAIVAIVTAFVLLTTIFLRKNSSNQKYYVV